MTSEARVVNGVLRLPNGDAWQYIENEKSYMWLLDQKTTGEIILVFDMKIYDSRKPRLVVKQNEIFYDQMVFSTAIGGLLLFKNGDDAILTPMDTKKALEIYGDMK